MIVATRRPEDWYRQVPWLRKTPRKIYHRMLRRRLMKRYPVHEVKCFRERAGCRAQVNRLLTLHMQITGRRYPYPELLKRACMERFKRCLRSLGRPLKKVRMGPIPPEAVREYQV